jgi:sec-independent protein translocase protein TatC
MALVPFPQKNAATDPEPDWDAEQELDEAGKMSFLDHLDELRRRLIYSLIGVAIGFVVAIFFIDTIFDFVMRPMQEMLPAGQTLIYTEPGEAFFLYIKIAVITGLLTASPLVFSQVWLFIAPGLYAHEKKMAIPFVVMSSVFFVAGAAFAHHVVFPIVWQFFLGFQIDFLTFMPRVESAFSTYLRLILACAVTFQLPTLVLFLARMGMITPRFMIRNFRYAFLIILVLAAVLSPDGGGVGMVAMAGPVVLLYVFSIGLAWLFGKKRRTSDDE